MAAADELEFEIPNYFRYYRSGRVERLGGTTTVPAGVDPSTAVDSRDVIVDPSNAVSARLYLPSATAGDEERKIPIVIYFHGGGFCIESAASPTYHRHLNALAALTPLLGVSVDYRRPPEHRLPAAYDDGWAALRWVVSRVDPWVTRYGDHRRVFLAGDSAGANIAHQVAARAAAEGMPVKGVALVHPFFWGTEPVGGEPRDAEFRERMDRRWRFTFPTAAAPEDPRWDPAAVGSPAEVGCERVMVAVAEKDFLNHRGRRYYEKLTASGWRGEAEFVETPAAGHVYHLLAPETEEAAEMIGKLVDFFRRD
ncbi:putative carboxylesterase 2 [Apostasia shenzhenica]|uniref:Putative carboxylesterase 2 n=1 Tax=Apostasia shenzhenica TaxID=1088818 RepID=A0A2I0A1N9_9ASPA|nr:putative carboxylesterase 2 [Apostasia shenzhenica]